MSAAPSVLDRLDHAHQFIAALAGSVDAALCLQTFDDSKRKRPHLAAILHGTFASRAQRLRTLNAAGAGIFVTVNQTDGHGRRSENVTGLRALFTDDDGAGFRDMLLPPSFVVHSARGPHSYFRLRDDEPLDRFKAAQLHLAEVCGTDRAVHDLPRVMRCPGFLHQKGEPFLVTFEAGDLTRRYSIDGVLAAFPLPRKPAERATPASNIGRRLGPGEHGDVIERARRYLAKVPPAIQGSGGDAHTLAAACRIVRGFDLSGADALGLLEQWSTGCAPPWSSQELETKIRNARRYGTEPIGGLLGDTRPLSFRGRQRARLRAYIKGDQT